MPYIFHGISGYNGKFNSPLKQCLFLVKYFYMALLPFDISQEIISETVPPYKYNGSKVGKFSPFHERDPR